MPPAMAKKLRFAALYTCYLLMASGALLYLFLWLPFATELRDRQPPGQSALDPPRHVTAETQRQLGSLAQKRPNSFVHFEQEQAAGIVRACAIGDSYTYGDEVDPGNDYPALLQALLRERGFNHVEVVNFGNNWHGFHQSFLLWDEVGRNFGCDYLLLGPASFQAKRDTEFNHTQLASPYYLHARYMLDGDDVRLVEVLGESAEERFGEYFRFLPRWRYLRYDRNPPPVALALVPRNRTLPNPFYYYPGSAEEESHATYRIMLRRMAESGAQIVLLHRWPAIVALAEELNLENLVAGHGFDQDRFPYRAARGHNSGWANRLLAAQFMAHLVEDFEREVPVVLIRDLPRSEPVADNAATLANSDRTPPTPISDYDRIELTLDGAPFGSFVSASRDDLRMGRGGPDGFVGKEITALLAVKDPRIPLTDAGYAPLGFAPAPGAALSLQVGLGATARVHPMGRIRLLAPNSSIAVANIEGFELAHRRELVFHGNRELDLSDPGFREQRMTLLIDGKPALEGYPTDDRVVFYPVRGALHQLAPAAARYREIATLPADGVFELTLHHSEQGIRQLPLASYRRGSVPVALARRALPHRIQSNTTTLTDRR